MSEDVNSSREGPRADFEPHTDNLRGGITMLVLGLVFTFGTFAVSDPKVMFAIGTYGVSSIMVPRVLALLVAATGVAVAAGFIPVRGPRDFYGGLVLILLAILALAPQPSCPASAALRSVPAQRPACSRSSSPVWAWPSRWLA